MRFRQAKAGLGIAALAALLAFGTTASAAPVSKCNAAKKKCIGKYVAAVMGCHSKAETKGIGVESTCLSKATAKITGGGKGCFDKADTKNDGCTQLGDAGSQLAAADAFIIDVVDDIDPNYPTPHINKCDAAEKKCAGKKASGLMGCSAKENKDGVGDPTCAPKIQGKFSNVDNKGCFDKAVIKNDGPCDGATAIGIETKVDNWVAAAAAALDNAPPTPTPTTTPTPTVTSTPGPGTCGNLLNDPGEPCDASAPSAGWAQCGQDFTCVACNCACPSKVHFAGDANDPATILDTGWTGIAHRAPVISNGDVTIQISCAASSRPCGVCNVSGPVANTGTNQLKNQRCSNDSSIQCTTNTPCTTSHCIGGANEDAACTVDSQCPGSQCSGVGTCVFIFGGPLPLVAGGVGTCVENQFAAPVSGTANVETGAASTVALLTSRVHSAVISTDTPCPTCVGDGVINDGVAGGTCNAGNRSGKACDGSGLVPGRPDHGVTSLDCPPPIATIAVLPIDLTNSTGTVNKTLSPTSPNCTAGGLPVGTKCVCDTCNNAAAEPCDSNADCPPGGVCGGRRCLGGTNIGAACSVNSQCPGGSCARPGQPTQPNGCVDDSLTPLNGLLCVDTAPTGDNEGECPEGPPTGVCIPSSGHPQRSCTVDAECCDDPPGCGADPPVLNDCSIGNRLCFLDNGINGNSITGTGMADPPVQDTSDPTLAAVFCIGPTSAPAVNIAAGLPGPGRTTLKGTATGHP